MYLNLIGAIGHKYNAHMYKHFVILLQQWVATKPWYDDLHIEQNRCLSV